MRVPSDHVSVSYSQFLELCNIEDPDNWMPGLRVALDGVWVSEDREEALTPQEAAVLAEHPDGDPSKPVLSFPCTLGAIRTRIVNFYSGAFIDPFVMADFLVASGQANSKPVSQASMSQKARRDREHVEILEAVLAVLWHFPLDKKTASGLARAVEEKAPLFWPESRVPPMRNRPLTDFISKATRLPES